MRIHDRVMAAAAAANASKRVVIYGVHYEMDCCHYY